MPKKTSIGNAKTGGDDLDDGLELEAGFLASDSEAESSSAGSLRAVSPAGSQGEDGFVYDGDDLDEDNKPRRPAPVAGSKRKAASPELGEEARKAEQRKKRRQKDKERKAKVMITFTYVDVADGSRNVSRGRRKLPSWTLANYRLIS